MNLPLTKKHPFLIFIFFTLIESILKYSKNHVTIKKTTDANYCISVDCYKIKPTMKK